MTCTITHTGDQVFAVVTGAGTPGGQPAVELRRRWVVMAQVHGDHLAARPQRVLGPQPRELTAEGRQVEVGGAVFGVSAERLPEQQDVDRLLCRGCDGRAR